MKKKKKVEKAEYLVKKKTAEYGGGNSIDKSYTK